MSAPGLLELLSMAYSLMIISALIFGFTPAPEALAFICIGLASSAIGDYLSSRLDLRPALLAAGVSYLSISAMSIFDPPVAVVLSILTASLALLVVRESSERNLIPPLILAAALGILLLSASLRGPVVAEYLRGEDPLASIGSLLAFLSFPSVYARVRKSKPALRIPLTVAVSLVMLSTGYRADGLLPLLTAGAFELVSGSLGTLAMLLAGSAAVYVGVDSLRRGSLLLGAASPLWRAATTLSYFSEASKISWPLGFFREPFYLLRRPTHPSRVVGPVLFGKEYGITLSALGNDAVSLGVPQVVLTWVICGAAVGVLRRRSSDSPAPYSAMLALMITRCDVGIVHLDVPMLCLSAVLAGSGRVKNGDRRTRPGRNHAVLPPRANHARRQGTDREEVEEDQGLEAEGGRQAPSVHHHRREEAQES